MEPVEKILYKDSARLSRFNFGCSAVFSWILIPIALLLVPSTFTQSGSFFGIFLLALVIIAFLNGRDNWAKLRKSSSATLIVTDKALYNIPTPGMRLEWQDIQKISLKSYVAGYLVNARTTYNATVVLKDGTEKYIPLLTVPFDILSLRSIAKNIQATARIYCVTVEIHHSYVGKDYLRYTNSEKAT
jgi:hypothetical protein